MKRALIVCPVYSTPGIDAAVRTVLEKARVLPRELRSYNNSGYLEDVRRFTEMMGQQFELEVLAGEVLGEAILSRHREWLLARDVSVSVFIFCGHGLNELSSRHGSLVASFGQLVSIAALDECARDAGFSGTSIRVLNMCEADGQGPSPYNSSLFIHGQQQWDSLRAAARGSNALSHQEVLICATGSFEKTSAGRGGSKFVEAMWRIFQENTTVTYATFAEQLAQHWPRGVVHQNGPPSTARFWEEKSLPDVVSNSEDAPEWF